MYNQGLDWNPVKKALTRNSIKSGSGTLFISLREKKEASVERIPGLLLQVLLFSPEQPRLNEEKLLNIIKTAKWSTSRTVNLDGKRFSCLFYCIQTGFLHPPLMNRGSKQYPVVPVCCITKYFDVTCCAGSYPWRVPMLIAQQAVRRGKPATHETHSNQIWSLRLKSRVANISHWPSEVYIFDFSMSSSLFPRVICLFFAILPSLDGHIITENFYEKCFKKNTCCSSLSSWLCWNLGMGRPAALLCISCIWASTSSRLLSTLHLWASTFLHKGQFTGTVSWDGFFTIPSYPGFRI